MGRKRIYGAPRLTRSELVLLRNIVASSDESPEHIRRAQIYLLCDEGLTNHAIAARLGISAPTVIKYLKLWTELGIENALRYYPRVGRPQSIPPQAKLWIYTIYYDTIPPAALFNPKAGWTLRSLHQYIRNHCVAAGFPMLQNISLSSVWAIVSKKAP